MTENPRIEDLRRRVQLDPASIAFAALAEEYRRAGQYEEAIAVCAGGLKRHPSYLSAHVTLGRALLETGRLEDAREALQFVLRTAPENLAAVEALGEINRRVASGNEPRLVDSSPLSPIPMPESAALGAPSPPPHAEVRALESFLTAVRRAR